MARGITIVRRAVSAGVLALAILSGPCLPAWATFSASAPLPQTRISTATIEAPTNVAALLNSCSNARWMSVTVSWTPSPTSRISGYSITAYRSGGSVTTVAQTDAATTSATVTVDKLSTGATTVVFTVTTMTAAGWTAESAQSGPLAC
jgi:hypothetical protein